MKYLKLEDNKGLYTINGDEWKGIDKINKDDLMKLLDLAISSEEFEMDKYDKDMIRNPAHEIIYGNIYIKFIELLNNKVRFKDESERMYKEAIDKYSKNIICSS
ncbi:hypothetical protein LGL55_05715 [Clostridium tagluense]|uniref:hypothetical protein n=1 Tax=Clostridium tagluense TaxID=360422 RepID=UPI001CF508B9|nr:hypothetical protein [Clostridium tagluense]MCB2310619.1 hypothetical protein [Clostridium tagluense]MCB2315650.1 hypothetical protein [Clostridium tagluense]MCB2320504.1 hypothetical protein [Clostridium tagluense]MCB2325213.1 hypothetical protein [Clostridium tagluense]MCB2330065.1 hypothetical protein [Clostridium tagluense]